MLVLTSHEINLFFHSEMIYQLIESITQLFSYIGSQNLIFSEFKLTVQMFILVELYHVYCLHCSSSSNQFSVQVDYVSGTCNAIDVYVFASWHAHALHVYLI